MIDFLCGHFRVEIICGCLTYDLFVAAVFEKTEIMFFVSVRKEARS